MRKELALEPCHQHVVLGQELFGIVRPQNGRRRKSLDSAEESIDVQFLFHLPVEGIRIDLEDEGLGRRRAPHLVDRAGCSHRDEVRSLYHTRRVVFSHDRSCDSHRQIHVPFHSCRARAASTLQAESRRSLHGCLRHEYGPLSAWSPPSPAVSRSTLTANEEGRADRAATTSHPQDSRRPRPVCGR